MNHTKLVTIIKTVVNEARNVELQHHGQRYGYSKKLAGVDLHSPNKTPQLAEDDDTKEQDNKVRPGLTMTKKPADFLNIGPKYNSTEVQHPQGSKPQSLDTK